MQRISFKKPQIKNVTILIIFSVLLSFIPGQALAQSSGDYIINIGTKQSITVLNHDGGPTRTPTPTAVLPINTATPSPIPSVTPPSCVYYFRGECRTGCYSDEYRLDNLSAFCDQSDQVCCICPILTPPACGNATPVMLTPVPGRGCPYYVCTTLTPTAGATLTPTGPTPTVTEEFIVNIGSKQSLTISIVEPAVSPTLTDILPTPTEALSPDTPTPTQELPSNTPIPTSSNIPTPTAETPTVTPTPDLTVTATPPAVTETPTPTLTRTPSPLSPSPTPDYSNEYVVNVGNKKSLTINIGQGVLTPSPTGPPVRCNTDNDCLDSQKCELSSNTCTEISCPMPPICNTYVKINHQCLLFNLLDGTACIDNSGNNGFCYSGVCSLTSPTPFPTVTLTPTVTPTPIATPTSIPVDPSTPRIRFSVKLFGVATTPDIKVRLKVNDLVAFLTPAPGIFGDSCRTPGEAEFFYSNIIMTADTRGVYRPKTGTTFDTAAGLASVWPDGWIPLVGILSGRNYSLGVKGPLHRNRTMESNIILNSGQPTNQDFDWTVKPLEPGDLPDPNKNLIPDCTINSIDLSLIESRIGNTNNADLNIADVNYDSIVNGNDIAKVVYTISFKPDDDTISAATGQPPVLNPVTTPTLAPILQASPTPTVHLFLTPTGTTNMCYASCTFNPDSCGTGYHCYKDPLNRQKCVSDTPTSGPCPDDRQDWRCICPTPTPPQLSTVDLIVSSMQGPRTYSYTICNLGFGRVTTPFYTRISNVNTGQFFDSYFNSLTPTHLHFECADSGPISCELISSPSCNIFSNPIRVRVHVDHGNAVIESNENNNIMEATI